jgi:hypothetical protein
LELHIFLALVLIGDDDDGGGSTSSWHCMFWSAQEQQCLTMADASSTSHPFVPDQGCATEDWFAAMMSNWQLLQSSGG